MEVFTEEILSLIADGTITSRRKLWPYVGGRTKNKISWLDDHHILVPSKINKKELDNYLQELCKSVNRIPVTADATAKYIKWAQVVYGSWNEAILCNFGEVVHRKGSTMTDSQLVSTLLEIIAKYDRLPLRDELNGKDYPYFETYYSRFNCSSWPQVIEYLIPDVSLKYTKKHGTGTYSVSVSGLSYLSSKERAIGDWLEGHGISFDKEVPYGSGSSYIFDFKVGETYIEYYGMATPEYLARVDKKRQQYNGRDIIEIFKCDDPTRQLKEELQIRGIL